MTSKMTTGERILYRRKQIGMSQHELAQKAGYTSRASIGKLELGKMEATQSRLPKLAKALGVTVGYLLGDDDDQPTNLIPIETKRIPILGAIACGQPILAVEESGEYADTGNLKADFALIAKGDSMTGSRIYDGDMVLCHKQDTVEDGQIAVVCIDDEATLKRFYYYPDIDLVTLRADNPAYKDLVYQGPAIAQIRVIGRAIGVQFPL